MPTILPRHTLTETAELSHALDDAELRWPEVRGDRSAALRKLVEAGWEVVRYSHHERLTARRAALHAAAGVVSGVYPNDAAQALSAEWPE
ncbi:hypothetical protein [Subtercola endophyticus]|uniref:hypothetical protein n=1 Tax=Subtercola endophyticus TaxID=2895559 RepID=UPI001E5ACD75|nr:hypothetical protein [Subtercola endophyticus]UFS59267.1 hypothetical protein LQ955_00225 [Subtercola endophyticus]